MLHADSRGSVVKLVCQRGYRAPQVCGVRVQISFGIIPAYAPCNPRLYMFVIGVCVATTKGGVASLSLAGFLNVSM